MPSALAGWLACSAVPPRTEGADTDASKSALSSTIPSPIATVHSGRPLWGGSSSATAEPGDTGTDASTGTAGWGEPPSLLPVHTLAGQVYTYNLEGFPLPQIGWTVAMAWWEAPLLESWEEADPLTGPDDCGAWVNHKITDFGERTFNWPTVTVATPNGSVDLWGPYAGEAVAYTPLGQAWGLPWSFSSTGCESFPPFDAPEVWTFPPDPLMLDQELYYETYARDDLTLTWRSVGDRPIEIQVNMGSAAVLCWAVDDGAFTIPIALLELGIPAFPEIVQVKADRARTAYAQLDEERWVSLTATTGTSGNVVVE
jgi:hypothetical protein